MRRAGHARTSDAQHGVALLIVLVGLVLLAVIAAAVSSDVATGVALARNCVETVQARQAAEAGLQMGIYEVLKGRGERAWTANGSVHRITIGEAVVEVSVQDEAGKVDLNHAGYELLRGLFAAVGVRGPQRDRLVDAILDWRDADELRRLNGAEDDDYRGAGYAYGAKDAAFESVAELVHVQGMTATLYRRLEPLVTVYSRQSGVDPALAPAAVMAAVPGGNAARALHPAQGRATAGGARSAASLIDRRHTVNSRGLAYTVASQARLREGASARLAAVVVLDPAAGAHVYDIVLWKSGGPEPLHADTTSDEEASWTQAQD